MIESISRKVAERARSVAPSGQRPLQPEAPAPSVRSGRWATQGA
jgi:hypothetical protein